MNISVAIYFILYTAIIGYLFYHVKGYLAAKAGMLIVMFYMASAIVFSFDSYMGWPARDSAAPNRMVMTGVVIFDKTNKAPGAIFVTGIPCLGTSTISECMESDTNDSVWKGIVAFKIFGYEPPLLNTPRIFEFEYTPENRKMFADAKANMANGGTSVFRRGGKKSGEAGQGEGLEGNSDEAAEGRKGGQGGEGTKNSRSEGASEIHVDNISLRDILRKDSQ